jgi:prepilin-type N-terminal cleavage/methylation domain-containing protein
MRGFTLIELMIVIALIGISTVVAGNAAYKQQSDGLAELQRERAAQVLEYQAECLASGRPASPATMARLIENLPGAHVAREREAATTRLVVSWRAPSGQVQRRSLVVFAKGGG